MLLNIAILVQGARSNGRTFSEKTTTLVVNAHGALIVLKEPVVAHQAVTITHLKTGETCQCRIVDRMGINPGNSEVGIEFIDPSPRFWHVAFPPEDWSPRSPEAKRVITPAGQETPSIHKV